MSSTGKATACPATAAERSVEGRAAEGPAASDVRTHSPLWEGRPVKTLIWLLIVAAVIQVYRSAEFVVVHVVSVLLLFVFAAVIALILTPVVDRMQRVPPFRRHRGLAVIALYVAGIALISAGVAVVIPSVVAQGKQLPVLITQLQSALNQRGIPFQISSVSKAISGEQIALALGVVATLLSGVVNLVLILVISIYLLIEGRAAVATGRNLFPKRQNEFDFMALAVGSTVAAYVRGQFIMSFIIGVYTGAALTLLGVHYGVLIGVAAFFLEFIPIVGALVAMVVAVAVALLQGPQLALLAGVVGLIGHALDGYVVGPRVNGRVTQLHALVAMAALLVGAELGGILGALFAVPIAAVANILLGALYRSRRGEAAMSTGDDGEVTVDTLPRLGEEVGAIEEEGIGDEPVPHVAGT